MPMWAATRLAPSSSPGGDGGRDGGDGERLVAERAVGERGDDARVDAAGERDDGAAEPAMRLDPRASITAPRAPPRSRRVRAHTTFTGSPMMRAARSQSACSGARLTILPSRRADLHTHRLPADLDREALAFELDRGRGARSGRRACSSRAASPRRTARSCSGRASAESVNAGAAALHLDRRRPDVERAGGEARPAAASGASSGSRSSRLASISETPPVRGLGAEDHADDVRQLLEVARAGAVARAVDGHRAGSGRRTRRARRRAPRRWA